MAAPSRHTPANGRNNDLEMRMTIRPDIEAEILRYYFVEKWRCGTIARQLSIHHGTV